MYIVKYVAAETTFPRIWATVGLTPESRLESALELIT